MTNMRSESSAVYVRRGVKTTAACARFFSRSRAVEIETRAEEGHSEAFSLKIT